MSETGPGSAGLVEQADRAQWRLRRAVFVRRVRLAAAARGATVDVRVDLDARIGWRYHLDIAPGTHNVIRVGPGCTIGDDVTLWLAGGVVDVGGWCDIRRGVVLNVSGRLVLEERNILSFGTVVHCAGETTIGALTGASDHVAIVDSTHYHSDPDVPFHDNVKTGTVTIGRNTWLGAKCTVTRNTRIGDYCVVGANSLVVDDVPDGHVAVGVPAACEPRDLPWRPGS